MQELAVGIRIFSRIVKSLEGSKGAAVYFAESTEFLYELQATLQNVQKYQDEVHSRRYCWDIFVFLEAMRSPCEKFIYFVEDYKPALADMQHFGSITLKLSIEEWNVLSRKIIELQDAICQPLKVAHTLLLLQSV